MKLLKLKKNVTVLHNLQRQFEIGHCIHRQARNIFFEEHYYSEQIDGNFCIINRVAW